MRIKIIETSSKSIGTAFPDWVFQARGSPEAERGEVWWGPDYLWSLTGAEEQSEESAPRSPAATSVREKKNSAI